MDSSTAGHTHRALCNPTELYRGAVCLDQADLRHSTSSTHEGAFWCVVTAVRCSYRLTEAFCCGLIQSAQLASNMNLRLLILNYEQTIPIRNKVTARFLCRWCILVTILLGVRAYRYLYHSLVTKSARRAGRAPYVCK